MTDQRLVDLIEAVLSDINGRRVATSTARRLAEEIIGDGYLRLDGIDARVGTDAGVTGLWRNVDRIEDPFND